MKRIDLPSPRPRETELPVQPANYRTLEIRYLPLPDMAVTPSFHDVVGSRRSRRKFGPINEPTLSTLLWLACKTRERSVGAGGVAWEHRPAPSAGGRHPIDVLLMDAADRPPLVSLYQPVSHALCRLDCDTPVVERLAATAQEVLPHQRGVTMWFAAQFERTLSKYEHGESLVWRDAGALLATLHLTAEALGLSYCALGHTGEPVISALLAGQVIAHGVGGCVIGSRLVDASAPPTATLPEHQ